MQKQSKNKAKNKNKAQQKQITQQKQSAIIGKQTKNEAVRICRFFNFCRFIFAFLFA